MNNEQAPLITLGRLEGNAPAQLGGFQVYLAPHADLLISLWWVVFFAVIAGVVLVHIAQPLFVHRKKR